MSSFTTYDSYQFLRPRFFFFCLFVLILLIEMPPPVYPQQRGTVRKDGQKDTSRDESLLEPAAEKLKKNQQIHKDISQFVKNAAKGLGKKSRGKAAGMAQKDVAGASMDEQPKSTVPVYKRKTYAEQKKEYRRKAKRDKDEF